MTQVTREQFKVEPLKVTHTPTGASFSTYEYDDADDVEIAVKNLGDAGSILEDGSDYCPNEIEKLARTLLKEQAESRLAS